MSKIQSEVIDELNKYNPLGTPVPCATPPEEELINSLIVMVIGREPLTEDFGRVELSYSTTNPNLRFISVDGNCLGALIYESETLIGDGKTETKKFIRFDSEIKR